MPGMVTYHLFKFRQAALPKSVIFILYPPTSTFAHLGFSSSLLFTLVFLVPVSFPGL